ncbi:MAG: protoheme IX farnesyltransferase, partial [Candidatus Eisenbacteria bacterium]|nr:protoheme IX farnesyltransferase [Candidatus Latescibacterota bacterium]MBD3301813.1 protoheme IX farnesyltransferase [Candidatus Eisenbacteria bacterium]
MGGLPPLPPGPPSRAERLPGASLFRTMRRFMDRLRNHRFDPVDRTAGRDGAVAARAPGRVALYLELGKAKLSGFVVATALVGSLVASGGRVDPVLLLALLTGTALASSGSLALNQWMERARDGRMRRTGGRPLPAGLIPSREALVVSLVSMALGISLLAVAVNGLTAVLALVIILVYALLYTPMKPRSPACTLVGAICGAIPPMMGWTAVTGRIEGGAWILGAVLFVWQIPHFLALAWMYREDYERGGFRMLPVVDATGRVTSGLVVLYTLALLPIGVAATLT